MDQDLAEIVARTLEATPALLSALPHLLCDLEELGARVHEVVPLVRDAGIGPQSRVLDLGCGKGVVAIAIASELGALVAGIDAMPAFVERARSSAVQAGVKERCTFEVGDVRAAIETERDYDLVSMLALGDALGDLDETVAALRQCVRPGGHILIDDAFLADDAPKEVALEVHCLDRAASHRLLTAHGDELVSECVIDGPEATADYREMTRKITRRAEELAITYPEQAALLREYAQRQQHEVELLSGPVVGVLWLLRRGEAIGAGS